MALAPEPVAETFEPVEALIKQLLVAVTLTNPFDAPGQDGNLRELADLLRRGFLMAEKTQRTEAEVLNDDESQPYRSMTLVLVEEDGELRVGYFEFTPPALIDGSSIHLHAHRRGSQEEPPSTTSADQPARRESSRSRRSSSGVQARDW